MLCLPFISNTGITVTPFDGAIFEMSLLSIHTNTFLYYPIFITFNFVYAFVM